MALTKKQREKQVVKVFDAYEVFMNLAQKLLREDFELPPECALHADEALFHAHHAMRSMRLEVEGDASAPMPKRAPPPPQGEDSHGVYMDELKALFSGSTDEDLEDQYEQAVEIRDWFTCDLICDEQDRRARQPVGY